MITTEITEITKTTKTTKTKTGRIIKNSLRIAVNSAERLEIKKIKSKLNANRIKYQWIQTDEI
jgi:hypothetical protein